VKTSQSHPLRIDAIELNSGGMIGMTLCPGKKQKYAYSGSWNRDLDTDLKVIRDWGAKALVCLIEEQEFTELGVIDLPEKTKSSGIAWHHLPIQDGSVPDSSFEEEWENVREHIHEIIYAGDKVVLHCKGGLGRTGLVAAMILVETRMDTDEAIRTVRFARQGAIETAQQVFYIKNYFEKQ